MAITGKVSHIAAAIMALSSGALLAILATELRLPVLAADALIAFGVCAATPLLLRSAKQSRDRETANQALGWSVAGVIAASLMRLALGGMPPDGLTVMVSALLWGVALTMAWWLGHGGTREDLVQAFSGGARGPFTPPRLDEEAPSSSRRRKRRPPRTLTELQGAYECPECGSLQTGPEEVDSRTGQALTLSCGACGHEWPCP